MRDLGARVKARVMCILNVGKLPRLVTLDSFGRRLGTMVLQD